MYYHLSGIFRVWRRFCRISSHRHLSDRRAAPLGYCHRFTSSELSWFSCIMLLALLYTVTNCLDFPVLCSLEVWNSLPSFDVLYALRNTTNYTFMYCIFRFNKQVNKSKFNQWISSVNHLKLFIYTAYIPKCLKFKQQKTSLRKLN